MTKASLFWNSYVEPQGRPLINKRDIFHCEMSHVLSFMVLITSELREEKYPRPCKSSAYALSEPQQSTLPAVMVCVNEIEDLHLGIFYEHLALENREKYFALDSPHVYWGKHHVVHQLLRTQTLFQCFSLFVHGKYLDFSSFLDFFNCSSRFE